MYLLFMFCLGDNQPNLCIVVVSSVFVVVAVAGCRVLSLFWV